jgi:hypothetical protein
MRCVMRAAIRRLSRISEWGTGADSGASVDQRRYLTVTLGEGGLARVQQFSEPGDALKTLGLAD